MRTTLPAARYPDRARWTAFHQELVRRVSALPGVALAGLNSAVPLEGGASESAVVAEGQPLPAPGVPGTVTLFQTSTPGYLQAIGIPLLRGRPFTDQDTRASTPVVIVDETLVQRLFPGQDPVGKRIAFEFQGGHESPVPVWREIVGVTRHVRHYGIASGPPYVQLHTPLEQLPTYYEQRRPSMALVVRTTLPPEMLTMSVRRELAAIDPDIPVYGVQTMTQYLAQNVEQPRLSVLLLGGLGMLALLLAVVGIYGVISYSVAQRTQEIGVRMALGATRGDVMRLVVGRAMILVMTGIVLGIGAGLATASVVRTMVFQVSERDPWTFAAIAALLAAVGLVASLVPARRASAVDPIVALRES
jgi:putative ABC transport system permease protein